MEWQTRHLSATTQAAVSAGGLDEVFQEQPDANLQQWLVDIGFSGETITVRKFFLTDFTIGIQEYEDYFADAISNPGSYSDEEIQVIRSEQNRWLHEGIFVLWLNPTTECWIDHSGRVVST